MGTKNQRHKSAGRDTPPGVKSKRPACGTKRIAVVELDHNPASVAVEETSGSGMAAAVVAPSGWWPLMPNIKSSLPPRRDAASGAPIYGENTWWCCAKTEV